MLPKSFCSYLYKKKELNVKTLFLLIVPCLFFSVACVTSPKSSVMYRNPASSEDIGRVKRIIQEKNWVELERQLSDPNLNFSEEPRDTYNREQGVYKRTETPVEYLFRQSTYTIEEMIRALEMFAKNGKLGLNETELARSLFRAAVVNLYDRRGGERVVSWLLNHPEFKSHMFAMHDYTPLHELMTKPDVRVEFVQEMIDHVKVDPNQRGFGNTPLMSAVGVKGQASVDMIIMMIRHHRIQLDDFSSFEARLENIRNDFTVAEKEEIKKEFIFHQKQKEHLPRRSSSCLY